MFKTRYLSTIEVKTCRKNYNKIIIKEVLDDSQTVKHIQAINTNITELPTYIYQQI